MKVRATEQYEKLNLQDNELKRMPKKGEEWEVSAERFKVLTKTNSFGVTFVEAVEEVVEVVEVVEVETAKKEVKTEKAIKKTTKKSK